MLINKRRKNLSDEELVESYKKSGKKDLVGELWNRYAHLIYGVCLKYLKNEMKSQDATIILFEGLFDKLKNHDVENFNKWVYVVAKNHCLMILRRDKKWKDKFVGQESLIMIKDDLEIDDDRESKLEDLEKAIETLNDEQKICIDLFYLKEKSYKEVAELTGFDLNKVKSNIQNGKRNLKTN